MTEYSTPLYSIGFPPQNNVLRRPLDPVFCIADNFKLVDFKITSFRASSVPQLAATLKKFRPEVIGTSSERRVYPQVDLRRALPPIATSTPGMSAPLFSRRCR